VDSSKSIEDGWRWTICEAGEDGNKPGRSAVATCEAMTLFVTPANQCYQSKGCMHCYARIRTRDDSKDEPGPRREKYTLQTRRPVL
jgi:hypothetical protein